MAVERRYHIAAVSLMVAGVVAGGVSWLLEDTAFWLVCGIAVVFIVVGLYFASHASAEQRKREEPGKRE